MDSVTGGQSAGVGSITSCQKWEDDHQDPHPHPPSPCSGLKPLPRLPSPLRPFALPASPSFLAGPSNSTRGSIFKSAGHPQVIDLDEQEDDFGFGDFNDGDDEGRWNPEDDEQGEQDDPGEEDMEDGLGEGEEEEEFFDEGFRGYADEVVIAGHDDDDQEQVRSASSFSSPFWHLDSKLISRLCITHRTLHPLPNPTDPSPPSNTSSLLLPLLLVNLLPNETRSPS